MRSMRCGHDQSGAAAIIVALSLVAIMAAAMLTIDAGMLWTQRRTVATASDAAALAEARRAALLPGRPSACGSQWVTMLSRNTNAQADPISCTVLAGTRAGQAAFEVKARLASPVGFGAALGVRDAEAFASSVARYDPVAILLSGARPMGLCTEGPHLLEWFSYLNGTLSADAYHLLRGTMPAHPLYSSAGVVHRIMYTKEQPLACGGAAGNWGFIDFNGGNNSTGELRRWLRDGYNDNALAVGDCNADNAAPGEWCPGNTGAASNSISNALRALIGTTFPLPLFDQVRGTGSNAEYRIAGFIGVILRGFRVTGAEAGRYLDLEFTSLIGSGRCCPVTETSVVDGGVRTVRLCSVDHDPLSVATRCT